MLKTSLTMPTTTDKETKLREEYRSMFYSYCLLSVGINPNIEKELIEQLMNENGYAIGQSENIISFGRKRQEPTPDGEMYDILASADIDALIKESEKIKAKSDQLIPAYAYAELLNELPVYDVTMHVGDLINDGVTVFIYDAEEEDIIVYGKCNPDENCRYNEPFVTKLYIDRQSKRIINRTQLETFMRMQRTLDLPGRHFAEVAYDNKEETLTLKGSYYPQFPFEVRDRQGRYVPGLAVQTHPNEVNN